MNNTCQLKRVCEKSYLFFNERYAKGVFSVKPAYKRVRALIRTEPPCIGQIFLHAQITFPSNKNHP